MKPLQKPWLAGGEKVSAGQRWGVERVAGGHGGGIPGWREDKERAQQREGQAWKGVKAMEASSLFCRLDEPSLPPWRL